MPTVIGTQGFLISSKGEKLSGVFGHTSIHIMTPEEIKKVPKLTDVHFDLGFASKKDAVAAGIEPGDRIQLTGVSFRLPGNDDIAVGKAMDNRAGVTVIDQLVQKLKDVKTNNNIFIVGTVQEEVGLRGAKTSVSQIEPDVAIAIDTCASHDTPKAIKGIQTLGAGAALRVKDGGTMMDPKLTDFLFKLGKKHNIPVYKYVAQGGGTDAGELQFGKGGVPTLTISIPQRYLHSPLGASSLDDIKAVLDLITEFIKTFGSEELKNISYK